VAERGHFKWSFSLRASGYPGCAPKAQQSLMRALYFIPLAALCSIIGTYPLVYLMVDGKIGILQTKSDALIGDAMWRVGFYTHIVCGGVALSVGWSQFVKSWRERYREMHRFVGKVYVLMACVSGLAGVWIAPQTTTGSIAGLGFGSLGVFWLGVTFQAYYRIRQRDLWRHERLMVYSYSACCAAVTLRLWLPLLIGIFQLDFGVAYPIVAWLCWLPNLWIAKRINSRSSKAPSLDHSLANET
jgi:uncharacterized membrane protein